MDHGMLQFDLRCIPRELSTGREAMEILVCSWNRTAKVFPLRRHTGIGMMRILRIMHYHSYNRDEGQDDRSRPETRRTKFDSMDRGERGHILPNPAKSSIFYQAPCPRALNATQSS